MSVSNTHLSPFYPNAKFLERRNGGGVTPYGPPLASLDSG